jgi:hypothetical protein
MSVTSANHFAVVGNITAGGNIACSGPITTDSDVNCESLIATSDVSCVHLTVTSNINGLSISNLNSLDTTSSIATTQASLQTQINTKAADSNTCHLSGSETISGSKTFTGGVVLSSNVTANGLTISPTELGYLDGATSNLQTQLNAKAGTATTNTFSQAQTFTGGLLVNSNVTANSAVLTPTELSYLDGATSNLQTQLNTNASNIASNSSTLASHSSNLSNLNTSVTALDTALTVGTQLVVGTNNGWYSAGNISCSAYASGGRCKMRLVGGNAYTQNTSYGAECIILLSINNGGTSAINIQGEYFHLGPAFVSAVRVVQYALSAYTVYVQLANYCGCSVFGECFNAQFAGDNTFIGTTAPSTTPQITLNGSSLMGFAAYARVNNDGTTSINSNCTVSRQAAGVYIINVTVPNNGLSWASGTAYSHTVDTGSAVGFPSYSHSVTCRGGGSSPALQDAWFSFFVI